MSASPWRATSWMAWGGLTALALILAGYAWRRLGQAQRRVATLERELTKHRLHTEAHDHLAERYRLLTEHSRDFVSEFGPDGRFLYVNSNFSTLLGYEPKDLMGLTPMEAGIVHPEDGARLLKAFNQALGGKTQSVVEFRGRGSHGDDRWYECAFRCHPASADPTKVLAISRDITDAKIKDDALRQRQKLESLGVLAGGIAHDFNNLLTAILGNLSLAETTLAEESPAQPYLDNVQKTVLKASDLCKQLLAYSGKGRFIVRPHDLNEVVQEMTYLLRVSLPKKVVLRYKLWPALPKVEADAAQIQQVVMNLVTNAADAIGDTDGTIWITTKYRDLDRTYLSTNFPNQTLEPGPFVVLEVSDTGCGIPPELRDRIFDPFFTTKPSGRGLGLSAMLGILKGHHAGIRIYSEVGRGSTFKLFFPALAPSMAMEDLRSGELETLFSGRVLVVDDEAPVRESVTAIMETLGLEVVPAVDGEEALAFFRFDPSAFDLVFMDLTMPRKDGKETFLEMRKLRPEVPVILTSGYNEQEALQGFIGKGLAGFLQKPYLLKDLKKALAASLGRSRTSLPECTPTKV